MNEICYLSVMEQELWAVGGEEVIDILIIVC